MGSKKPTTVTPEEVLEWCNAHEISAELLEHKPIGQTNEEAAKVLQVPIDSVLKSIVFQANPGGQFGVIQQGTRRIDASKARSVLKTGKPALVPPGILRRALGAEPGTVSPFLFAIKGIPAIVESTILEMNEVVATAGSPTHSIRFAPSVFEKLGYKVADVTEAKGKGKGE